jgi:hypothetical protein
METCWITAFCFWDSQGNCFYRPNRVASAKKPTSAIQNDYSEDDDDEAYQSKHDRALMPAPKPSPRFLDLDGIMYHYIETTEIPSGYASVPVKLVIANMEKDLEMVVGSVGMKLSRSPLDDTRLLLYHSTGKWMVDLRS